jgi:putative Mg2+ transporter-C (MgtC) family protein
MDLFTRIAIMDQLQVLLDAFVASVLGGLIGWERDRAGKSAGPRTMALVATAASMVVSIGVIVDRNAALGDPTRAMHAVITGIGFLGAGLIFNGKASGVQGVTTAATVFATAAVGSAVGLGFQLSAVGITVLLLAILRSTHMLEAAAIKLHLTENEQND